MTTYSTNWNQAALRQAYDSRYIQLAQYFHKQYPRFVEWTASSHPNQHHFGAGGLHKHTAEVINLMLSANATLKSGLPEDVIMVAGLFHDIGKLWDYKFLSDAEKDHQWVSTWDKRHIYHISRSGIEWSLAVERTGLYKEESDEILHAILAHHGQKAWGSPVEPKTQLAYLLHLSDNLSARMNDWQTIGTVQKYK